MIKFANNTSFILMIGVPVLILFFIWVDRKKQKLLSKFGELELIQKLTQNRNTGAILARRILIVCAYTLIVLALARPQLGTKMGGRTEKTVREGIDLVVAIDVSQSMLAEDVTPNRIAKAKYELKTLIKRLKGDRIGIVAFAGDAFRVCPLTVDYEIAMMIMEAVDVGTVPEQGTNLNRAIDICLKSFVESENREKVILLLTDGEGHEGDPVETAKAAKEQGITIFTVGIGSPKGVPVPDIQTGRFLKDSENNVVTSKLDEITLQRIALATEGKYYPARPGAAELDEIIDAIDAMDKKSVTREVYVSYEEIYSWVLVPGLMILLVSGYLPERKRKSSSFRPWWE